MNHALILKALARAYSNRECVVTPAYRLTYERSPAEGFDGYMPKPIQMKDLPRVVQSYLGGQA